MNRLIISTLAMIFAVSFLNTLSLFAQTNFFDYKRYLFGTPVTLTVILQSIDTASGIVMVNGGDTQAPSTPFTWNWGDGSVTGGFFPQLHIYSNRTKNYILKVTANYSGGKKDSSDIIIRFVPSTINPTALSPDIAVHIPTGNVTLATRLYTPPSLPPFDDRFFTSVPRTTMEYILSAASSVEKDFVNDDVYLFNSKFEQVMLRDSSYGGAYSLWFTDPVAFGVGDVFMSGSIGYSSLFHEMGHNYTLNSPASYYYGGRIDGDANAIFSETMAQIFQHAAGYELINNYQEYGFSEDLMMEIKESVISSVGIIRSAYEGYLSSGKPFAGWNNPNTSVDETNPTFMTLAYKFCEQAENTGQGYRAPLKRMMKLLQGFNESWSQRYDQLNNTAPADTFRATLMVTAMSYGFSKDLRSDFKNLNFPISDQTYYELVGVPDNPVLAAPVDGAQTPLTTTLSWHPTFGAEYYTVQVSDSSDFSTTVISVTRIVDTSIIVAGLSSNTTYYWHVSANNSAGAGAYSPTWTFSPGATTGVRGNSPVPTEFILSQNYPNPFNPSTTISYALPISAHVVLEIYNVLGERIAALVDEIKEAGYYHVQWEPQVSSGVYICRLQAGSFIESKKLLLLR